MKNIALTLKRAGLLICLAIAWSSHGWSASIADRLVLEVDNTSYSQRQFELYVVLRSALYGEDASKIVFVTEKNWAEQLEFFRLDMLVEQEAQRLSTAPPGKRVIDAGVEVVKGKIERSPRFKEFLARMDADDAVVRRTLTSVLRVKSFLVSRGRQYGADVSRVEEKAEVDRSADWFIRLEQRTPFRIFEGARRYEAIDPKASSAKRQRS